MLWKESVSLVRNEDYQTIFKQLVDGINELMAERDTVFVNHTVWKMSVETKTDHYLPNLVCFTTSFDSD